MICIILGLAPFAAAQDVHHELAAADTDGHEHSDTDICQWVQHHIAGSVDLDLPRLAVCDLVRQQELSPESVLLSTILSFVGPSRAPPQA
jgi:3',5'-cyclic AMP phosphodiesterase CpdA